MQKRLSDRFAQDGFAVVPDFVSSHECKALRERMSYLTGNYIPSPDEISIFSTNPNTHVRDQYFLESGNKIRFFFEEGAFDEQHQLKGPIELMLNKVGHALHDLDQEFHKFSRSDKIFNLALSLGMQEPRLIQSMYIFKQPLIGGEVNCHQDGTFLYTIPNTVIGLWFALEDATIENGCLWAIPGGHRYPLKSRFSRKPNDTTGFTIFDETPWPSDKLVPIEVSAGSLVVLHDYLPHLSHMNKSNKSRHAYTLHLMESSSDFPADNWLRPC